MVSNSRTHWLGGHEWISWWPWHDISGDPHTLLPSCWLVQHPFPPAPQLTSLVFISASKFPLRCRTLQVLASSKNNREWRSASKVSWILITARSVPELLASMAQAWGNWDYKKKSVQELVKSDRRFKGQGPKELRNHLSTSISFNRTVIKNGCSWPEQRGLNLPHLLGIPA